jgi:ADP-ribose pyrophosphatase
MSTGERVVVVHRKTRLLDAFLKVDNYEVTYSRVSGEDFIRNQKLLVMERGDSAAALIHVVDRDVVILTEQFRLPTYAKGPGWLVETVAGSIMDGADGGETPEECIRREMLEEVGYRAGELRLISSFYASPGGSSERVFLFYAPVHARDLIAPAASGLAEIQEDIRRIELPMGEFMERCKTGGFQDAKLIIAGLWCCAREMKT